MPDWKSRFALFERSAMALIRAWIALLLKEAVALERVFDFSLAPEAAKSGSTEPTFSPLSARR